MRTQTFGVEIELTGLTRRAAAEAAAEYFGTAARYEGGCYDRYTVTDTTGRRWNFVSDSSIRIEKHNGSPAEAVEFRCFNSTTHAGKVKAYVQFCLAISHQAIVQKSTSAKVTKSDNEKYTFRSWLLRMGLIGDEFKTCRKFLLQNLDGDIAWRHAA